MDSTTKSCTTRLTLRSRTTRLCSAKKKCSCTFPTKSEEQALIEILLLLTCLMRLVHEARRKRLISFLCSYRARVVKSDTSSRRLS